MPQNLLDWLKTVATLIGFVFTYFQTRRKADQSQVDRLQRKVTRLIGLFEDSFSFLRSTMDDHDLLVKGLPDAYRPPFVIWSAAVRRHYIELRDRLDAVDDAEEKSP
jgi:hypothetical protein